MDSLYPAIHGCFETADGNLSAYIQFYVVKTKPKIVRKYSNVFNFSNQKPQVHNRIYITEVGHSREYSAHNLEQPD